MTFDVHAARARGGRAAARTNAQFCAMAGRHSITHEARAADGSAHLRLSSFEPPAPLQPAASVVIASVLGPRSVPSRLESSHALLDVTCGAAIPPPAPQRAATTVLVRGALESAFLGSLHPRTRATLSTVVVSDNGCALASSVTAASAACSDAGLPLSHTICASRSLAWLAQSD